MHTNSVGIKNELSQLQLVHRLKRGSHACAVEVITFSLHTTQHKTFGIHSHPHPSYVHGHNYTGRNLNIDIKVKMCNH